ncbi:MAG: hypothetical protein HQ592_04120, partial [Planctomycetes bacterium]|nr:hypothetical protein [Planctomycetota bacterium]
VSADGTHAGSEFPWPNAGVAMLPDVSWKQYGNGCNGCMAPDNSYRYFHMGGTTGHQGVMMYDAGGANKREVWFKNILGMERGHSWIPRWSTDVRFLTVNCPIGGNGAEVYLGQFDEEFTKVVRWIKITNQPGQDTKAYCWIDPGLGYHTGEVPLTVDIPAPGEGQWEWDFGDGEKANALAGKRTYEKPGEYRITARQGDTIVKGSARAFPAKPPAAAHVRFYDETNLAVVFDERVQLKDANISLASGTPVKSWTLDGDGINLTLELGGRIADNDALLLKGVYDRAQVPNALSDEPLPLKRPAWPTDRTDLAFLWESANKPSFQYNANAKEFTDTKLNNKERATYGPFGEMSLEGGILLAVDGGGGIYAKATKANQLTIQALITPANAYQGWGEKPRSIINCGGGGPPSSGNFRLAQERSKLVFYLRQRSPDRPAVERIELCNITDQAANHVIVSYQPGDLVCYLNGKQVLKTDKVNGTLNWGRPSFESGLNFGGSQVWEDDANPGWTVHGIGPSYPVWRGKVEGIALYARAIGPEEATANFQAYNAIIKARPVAPRITVRGKLAAKSVVPKASEIAPYRDALVVYEYDVEKVLKGKYGRKKIRVARWGLINARPAPLSRAKLGDTAELLIEPRENHPQLDAEVTRDTLDENFDLPIYVDVGNGPTGKPRLGSIRITPYEVWVPPGEKQQYTTIVLDQYRVPIDAPLQWSVTPGGSVNTGAFYGGARHIEHQKKGSGTVDQNGLFVSDGTIGTVTITAAGKDDPSVKGNARIAVDNYPSIAPWGNQLAIGAQLGGNGGITGDIDRVRVYNRALTDEEILASSKGKLTGKSLVADWAFDTLKDGTFANTAGQGLTAKILGEVEHVKEDGRAFIRLTSKWGCVLVNCDPRLDMSHSATFELWVRPTKPEQGTLLYKATPGTPIGFQVRLADGLA